MNSPRFRKTTRFAALLLAVTIAAQFVLTANVNNAAAAQATMAATMPGTMSSMMSATMAATMPGTAAAFAPTCDKTTGLNLYAAVGYDSFTIDEFKKQTGITVNLVDDSTGNLLAKISAEGVNPQWDATWFDGDVAMQALDDQGFLLHWDAPNIVNYNDLGKKVMPASHAYYPTGVSAASPQP